MYIFIIFIQYFVLTATANDFLEFVPISNANTNENIYLTDKDPSVNIDATSKTSRNIYLLGTSELTTHIISFACKAGKRKAPLSDVQFCCRSDSFKQPLCNRLFSKPLTGTITCENLIFDYEYNKETGAYFNVSLNAKKEHKSAYNGLISCSVSDSEARIESNEIELRDAIFYANQLGVVMTNDIKLFKPVMPPSDFPLVFKCGNFAEKMTDWPSWMAAIWNMLTPYEWAICSFDQKISPVGCAQTRNKLSIGDSETTMDGTLYILNDRLFIDNPNSALICVIPSSGDPIRTYASQIERGMLLRGFTVDENAPKNEIKLLTPEYPLEHKYQFIDGTSLNNFNLWAFYRAPLGASVYAYWFKDGKRLSSEDAKDYSLRLPSKVERKMAGRYELKVNSAGYEDLNFVYTIDVVGPPKFTKVDCIEDLYYLMEGSEQMISCSVGAGSSKIKVGINGFESNTPRGLKAALASSLELANQPINELNIDFDVQGDDIKGRTVTVTVKNLKRDQNFRLAIKASNSNGQSQVAGTLRVVPKPVLSTAPKDMSCRENCDKQPYEVQCVTDESVKQQWDQVLNITNRQDWLISRTFTAAKLMADPDLSPYFRFNPVDPSTIMVSPMEPFQAHTTSKEYTPSTQSSAITPTTATSSKQPSSTSKSTISSSGPVVSLQEMLNSKLKKPVNSLQIECRYRLYVNNPRAVYVRVNVDGFDTTRRRRSGNEEDQRKIYDSFYEKDKSFVETLTAARSFSEYIKPAMSSFAWISAVVISVLFIIAVIAVAVWLCTRDRGETYKLYRKECELGNDPLMELKEKETFQTYERPEEPPTMASRHSLNEGSVDVGSDDEGELEAYSMDPDSSTFVRNKYRSRNFNEDASYIGAYTPIPGTVYSNDRARSDHHTAV